MKTVVSFLLMSGVVLSYLLMTNETDMELSGRAPSSIPQNYDLMKGCQKQDALWERVQSSIHKELPDYRKFGVLQLISMSMQELTKKGELHSDFSPEGWRKYLHRRGSLARVKIVPVNEKYTGVFQGADCALLRLSLTYRPSGSKPVAPGLALKVLRDGTNSANVSALVSLDGQGDDFNFFSEPMSNIVPTGSSIGQKLVHRVFRKVSKYPEELLTSDMASVDAHGQKVKEAKAPRQIFFVPGASLKFASEKHDVRDDFANIPEGTIIYQVYALSEKQAAFDYSLYTPEKAEEFLKDSEHIADIVSTSSFVASEFGDDGIFFRHQLRPKY